MVLTAARGGVITGVLLAIARIAGETAPLLFTVGDSNFWSVKLDHQIAAMPVKIYLYAGSPYETWQAQAWTGALVLVLLILIFSLASRYATRGRFNLVR